jgi:hypothetical protein
MITMWSVAEFGPEPISQPDAEAEPLTEMWSMYEEYEDRRHRQE